MSKIGKQPIIMPAGVSLEKKGRLIKVTGPKGNLEKELPQSFDLELKIESNQAHLIPKRQNNKQDKALWGTWQSLVKNMVEGVANGFAKVLEFQGVGYRASVEGSKLLLSLGLSHPVSVEAPEGISFKTEKNTIIIEGIDKELVGQIAAKIRRIRPPEPYKGAGIKYQNETIRRKEGKKSVSSGF